MRTLVLSSSAVLAAGALAFAATRSASQEPEFPQPTRQHEELLEMVGSWEGTIRFFGPEMPAEPSPATETIEAIGEFWIQSRFECEFMGGAFVGTGAQGYDPAKGAYVGTWIDSMTSSLTVMEGQKEGDALVMRWDAPNPMDGKMAPHRGETVHKGDSYTSTFYLGEGEGVKIMEIAMTRKGKKPMEAGSDR